MRMILKSLHLENFKGVTDKTYNFGNITRVKGENRLGKTTIGTALFWLFSDRNYELESNPNIRPDDGRECVPTVTAVLDVDGKEITVAKMQIRRVGKPDANGVSKVTLSNSYEINSVPKNGRDFTAYMEELGLSFENFLVCSHPNMFTKDLSQKKKQDEMREHLFAMSHSKTDLEIAQMSKDTADVAKLLESYKFEEIEAMNNASKKKAVEQLEAIPNQIIGLQAAKVDVDVAEQELLKSDLERKIEAVEDLMAKSDVRIDEMRSEEMHCQFEMSAIAQTMNNELSSKKREIEHHKYEHERKLEDVRSSIRKAQDSIESSKKSISEQTLKKSDLVKKYNEEVVKKFDDSKWTFDESTTTCSLCGQRLPEDKIESLRADFSQRKADAIETFNEEHAKTLAMIVDDGNACAEMIKKLTENNKELENTINTLKLHEAEEIDIINGFDEQISKIPASADYMQNAEYVELKIKQDKLLADIAELESKGTDKAVEDLKTDKAKLNSQLDEVNKVIAQASNNVRIDEQIAEKEHDQRKYGQAKADAEKILYQLKEVSKRKNDLLVDEINSHFSIVRWKLYDYQKNGEYKEVCVPTVPDEETGIYKVFGKTTNTGREIEAKIDICNSFQKFYGMQTPIVLDGAESINNKYLPKVDTQLILLSVSEDKQLKVEGV